MERPRKAYLLRKSDFLDHLTYNNNPQIIGNAACSCNKSSATRSYDLQTQTISFEEEPFFKTDVFSNCELPFQRNLNEDCKKVPDSCPPMDQDLEFYPVDDHPSPSTFTAWDAFLAGNQAFFREPPGLLPDPAFSYMDVIPEEDDLEALLESDTDDTGSSVSTVIDRFSRTSTANSSFSERCKGTTDVTFDLQKVLSPFERLEKELDADESKDDQDLQRRKLSRGPIVVITNSSSCEDVHSAEEEESSNPIENTSNPRPIEETIVNHIKVNDDSDSNFIHLSNELKDSDSVGRFSEGININNSQCKLDTTQTPIAPARSKITNGSKSSEKDRNKSDKKESSSPRSNQKKKSYPTPSVPPRMSKHLPARRTRSDPGDQPSSRPTEPPSRIPRPISNSSRSPNSSTTSKATPKSNRSPKLGIPKKLKFVESPKSNRNSNNLTGTTSELTPSTDKNESTVATKISEPDEVKILKDTAENSIEEAPCLDVKISQDHQTEIAYETNNQIDEVETVPNNTTVITPISTEDKRKDSPENLTAQILDLFPSESDFVTTVRRTDRQENSAIAQSVGEKHTNPFRNSETNPFKVESEVTTVDSTVTIVESKNPFVKRNNPFEESLEETTPALQPKGQISALPIAPPIPERVSLRSIPEQELKTENEIFDSPLSNPVSTVTEQVNNSDDVSALADGNDDASSVSDPSHPIDILGDATNTFIETTPDILEAIETTLHDMDIIHKMAMTTASKPDIVSKQNDQQNVDSPVADKGPGPQRPIEDILQALDQLVLSAPREVEISIDWGARGPINIREKAVLPSDPSGDRSEIVETDGLTEDRRRDIETLLKEVDECLRLHKVSGEDLSSQQPTESNTLPASDSLLSTSERTALGPGSLDAPTAGSTPLNLCQHDDQGTQNSDVLLEHSSPTMLKHQSQNILASEKRVNYSVPYQEVFSKTTEQLEDSHVIKHHSPGCDDSGVFLEDPIASSPETQSRSAANRLQSTLDNLSKDSIKMRQYSIHEGLDSDAERSDDLGLASSSVDSADDLDGDPLPSTLHPHCPPMVTSRQKPPPVPARKSLTLPTDYQKNNRYYTSDSTTLEVPNQQKPPLSKSSSSGEDSNFDQGDRCINENNFAAINLSEKSKNILNQQKNEQSRSNFAMTRSYHEDMLSNQLRDSNQDSKSNFLARTLSSSPSVKKLDVPNGNQPTYARRNSEQPTGFKWKSEECLRTAAENKWSISGRRYEKAVSVKDRIAMFSEMEANQSTGKREDLQRYGSETNIKAISGNTESKKLELSLAENNNMVNPLKDSKWHSMHSINKKPVEKEPSYTSSNMKPALSIPSLTSNNLIDSISNNYSTLPVKLEVEPPKAIVSTYPETQLTNNKRYNYGLYSLKNLKNTENLLSKKIAGSNLLSIIDSRKQPTQKLKGLVIPDKPYQVNTSKELPTIMSSDSDSVKEPRRASLPIAPVITTKAMSLPRNKKLECVPAQRQTSLTEPPWKNETNNNSLTLPKYSPAFKKRSLELPGSSLSPTPPSSITSPMSPPPSSPSSICSSNASSTLQQNVFQFSLSHSKPVQPLQPEKALMSPPSMPSDVEYEGDNSEDSSHSASPMRNSAKNNKDIKLPTQHQTPDVVNYGRSNTFTSSTKTVCHQPMMVEDLMKSPIPSDSDLSKPKAAIYLSKTEILLKKDETKSESLSRDQMQDFIPNELTTSFTKSNDQILPVQDISNGKSNGTITDEIYLQLKNETSEIPIYEKKERVLDYCNEYYSNKTIGNSEIHRNGNSPSGLNYLTTESNQPDIPVGKFRALPVSLETKSVGNNVQPLDTRSRKIHESTTWGNGRPLYSECDESEDDDSHSTLSHRTEDSRHTTTDDCLSDATTDSFEKPRLLTETPNLQRCNDDNASTEGYLSDASTDVSIRRFANRSFDSNAYSTEDYLSDATAESPDPDWVSNRGPVDYSRSKSYGRNYGTQSSGHSREEESTDKNVDLDLRPRRLSQQKTVLRAAVEPSGSVQKFKALAEKWEQRTDITSPPPPPVAPLPPKKDTKNSNSIAAAIISSTCMASTITKGKGTLPPSLMPRNSTSEKKTAQATKSLKENNFSVRTVEKEILASADGIITRKSFSSTSTITETSNGWNPYDEPNCLESRRGSTSSASNSSKTTLKDDEVFDSPPPLQPESSSVDGAKYETSSSTTANSPEDTVLPINAQSSQRLSQASLSSRHESIFNNEARNRRGADFSKSNPIHDWPKSTRPAFGAKSTFSVSDIRRSFENGSKEPEKPPMPATRISSTAPRVNVPSVAAQTSPPVATKKPTHDPVMESDDELRMVVESARNQLQNEGIGNQFDVLNVVLRREGEGGGSVGITLAGGADYEVKEITVHKVISGSIADRDGRVLKGDRVMSINGRDLRGVSHGEALHILKAPSPKVILVLARDKSGASLLQNGISDREVKKRQDLGNSKDSEMVVVELLKDATGLGFSIEGGRDSPQGDRPLLIKRIFKGGAADKDGQLEEGDEIISVNNQPVSNMTRTEAWNFLKKLPEGPVLLKARKASPTAV